MSVDRLMTSYLKWKQLHSSKFIYRLHAYYLAGLSDKTTKLQYT